MQTRRVREERWIMASEHHGERARTASAAPAKDKEGKSRVEVSGSTQPTRPTQPSSRQLDRMLDEALEESFPASDPVAIHIDRTVPAPDAAPPAGGLAREDDAARKK